MSFDQSVLDSAVGDRAPWLIDVVTVVTHSGGTVAAWIVSTVLTIALLLRDRRREAVLVAGAMLSGLAVMTTLKNLFERYRPPLPDRLVEISTFSFPSGHAMMTAILASVLVAVTLRVVLVGYIRIALVFLLVLYTLAVGLSRVYLAAHWMTDVLAGWAFGALWAAFWILLTHTRPRRTLTSSEI
ncbi:phosphatase PAP2 family protein [Rhodococcus opacus]|uniref:phosphatase PAP2 family protein n=1 Tax=Rhodococcus opacus TaxID=37919 RepID=UPI001FF259C8|nr:phosphatase PAP2 family protein [Rhodococcus opacus]UOT05399.1 phosphatase PAP2 family protein [Rhodococcus opacus]